MKKLLSSFVVVLSMVAVAFPSPLVLKTSKSIDSPEAFAELLTVDTSKFQRLRIYIDNSGSANPTYNLLVQAVEGDEVLVIQPHAVDMRNPFRANLVIETPPTKLRISIKGQGTFKAFIWGS